MGNCQAAEAAMVVIQHPGGRVDRFYWPPTAGEVMKSNPGHYVALVTLCVAEERRDGGGGGGTVRFTRVRLLKPKDTLILGQAYRLVTSQEVAKALKARKQEKMKRMHTDLNNNQQQQQQQKQQLQRGKDKRNTELLREARELDAERTDHQGVKQVVERQKTGSSAARARHWRPSLQSISEFGS